MNSSKLQRICLVHYHEIGLKGKNRSYFENKLKDNILEILKKNNYTDIKLIRISGRILLNFIHDIDQTDSKNIYSIISRIPGCARVSCGFKCNQTLEDITFAGCKVMEEASNVESFKVSARRNHTNFQYDSMEINKIVGGNISDAFPDVKVQMKNPSLDIKIEVIEGSSYVYATSIKAVGGLPVGVSGKLVALLSSGIDSPVALWKMARRGASITAVHFSGAPIVSDESEYLCKEICDVLASYGCVTKLYIVRIGTFQKAIAESCPEKLRIILYRRFMYKIAEQIALQEQAKALVTGESLGQVASQTVDNLAVTNAAVNMQVFRPLIGSDKQEIIQRAIDISTFELSSQTAPDCCTLFMPKTPETHAKLKYVEMAEKKLDFKNWINQAIEEMSLYTPK